MSLKKRLHIFVENFSSDSREEFFERELPFLSQMFDEIIITPLYPGNINLAIIFPNVKVIQFDVFASCNRIKIFIRHFILLFSIYFFELFNTHHKLYYIKQLPSLINLLILRIAAAERLFKTQKVILSDTVYYSYWFSQFALILSIFKKFDNSVCAVSRVHGSDYNESQTRSVLPFRYFQLNFLNSIIPVSQFGANYLIRNFGLTGRKLYVNRLGLNKSYRLSLSTGGKLNIVSCSSLIPLKRVHLIIDILSHITSEVTWHHFGTGPELSKVQELSRKLQPAVKHVFHGYVPNRDFLMFISENEISFFINVSEFEGIPVTLIEAASLGIPLIGTDTCGIPEIVTNETGFLIPLKFDPASVAKLIESEHFKKDIYQNKFRLRVQEYYNLNFSASKNFTALGNYLQKISK